MLSYAAGAEVASVPKIGKTVVVDAGHGGIDGGVVGSASGVKESEINLAIAKSLKHFLERNGYDVVMTRENSDGLYGLTSKNKKLRDMEARRDIIKEAKPDLVISVHQNYYPLSSVRGAQVFYSADSEISKQIADSMQGTLNTALGNDRIAKTGDYYIVNCTDFPSVIVECGFLSNPEEEKLLVTAAYQEKVAYSVFSAVHSIFGTETEHEHS
jgi:N-acetylmuramoyl-L-alanine amidase